MPQYDPQRSRPRHKASDEEPAPVDALLEPHPSPPDVPAGMAVEHVGDEVVVHTADADVEITASGDDVVVHTRSADVEVRPEVDEVVVSTGNEDLYVDLAVPGGPAVVPGPSVVRRVAIITALVAALVAIVVWMRRRTRHRD